MRQIDITQLCFVIIVTIHKAKAEFPNLVKCVEAGEDIIIARGDKPIAVLKGLSPEESVAIRKRLLESGLETKTMA